MNCPTCGIPVNSTNATCPKCDTPLVNHFVDLLSVVDVAHNGEDWPTAKRKILNAVSKALETGRKGIKIIHGRGESRGHSSVIKKHSSQFLNTLARQFDAKLVKDRNNDGAKILYFNS